MRLGQEGKSRQRYPPVTLRMETNNSLFDLHNLNIYLGGLWYVSFYTVELEFAHSGNYPKISVDVTFTLDLTRGLVERENDADLFDLRLAIGL